jgi:hypothetical protein
LTGTVQIRTKKDRPIISTAQDMIQLLREKYPPDAYALLTEVGNSTGFGCRRHCDALVMSLWPSRGLEIIGIEVKVRRSDWLKELSMPEKAEEIARYCDRWYLAVGDENIVQEGELPRGWGLIVPKVGGTLRIKAEAKLTEPEPQPDRAFLAAILRQVQNQVGEQAAYNRGFNEGKKESDKYHKEHNWEAQELQEMKKMVAAFEKSSGVNMKQSWHGPEKIGQAVQAVLDGMHTRVQEQLENLHAKALKIAFNIENELEIKHIDEKKIRNSY